MNTPLPRLPITPSSIAKKTFGDITFRIPLYQRPYAWEEPEVAQLLDDLWEAFNNGPKDHYHIGILSVARTPDDTARYDLIDGQQRITTLMVIGKATKNFCCDWKPFLTNRRLHLFGRKGDQDFLEDDVDTKCNRKLVDAFVFAKEYIQRRGGTAEAFAEYIFNHAAFFLAELPAQYSLLDKNQHFVRMNNRGKQLEKHEILKVKLIGRLLDVDRNTAFKSWNEMADCLTGLSSKNSVKLQSLKEILTKPNDTSGGKLSDDLEESLYSAIVSISEFLLIALARYCSKVGDSAISHNTDKLIETFSDTLLKPGEAQRHAKDVAGFIEVLAEQVRLLKNYIIFKVNAKDAGYELGSTSEAEEPLLGEEPKNKKRLIVLQSFLYVSTKPYHWMIPAFDWLESHTERGVDAAYFINKLEEIDNALIKTRDLPLIDRLDEMKYPAVNHYWFYRLDYELWKLFPTDDVWKGLRNDKEAKRLVEDFRFRLCGSIEHINPQTRATDANQPAAPEPDHSFGNLALISASRNSKFSNYAIGSKKEYILESGYTESLKMLHFLWCESMADIAGDRMYKILKEAVPGF